MLRAKCCGRPVRNTCVRNCHRHKDQSLKLFLSQEWCAFSAILECESNLRRHRQCFITEELHTQPRFPMVSTLVTSIGKRWALACNTKYTQSQKVHVNTRKPIRSMCPHNNDTTNYLITFGISEHRITSATGPMPRRLRRKPMEQEHMG